MQKVATVTGAARGIGLATVKRFLSDGWRVALLDIDEETLNRSAAVLGESDNILAIRESRKSLAGRGSQDK